MPLQCDELQQARHCSHLCHSLIYVYCRGIGMPAVLSTFP
uniref:Similar to EBS1 (EMS-MUTAGENIZED BRI1 SUPPRESSOR 1) n=1 Tax=Arundo donax TaxID=35708 RepID=A0A0A9H0P2_ARUDO